jgi:hypothetical protein
MNTSMTNWRQAALGLTLAVASFTARADVYCSGTVRDHLVYHEGTVMLRATWKDDWHYVCNLKAPWKGVSTETCYTWFAILAAAKIHAKPIGIYYSGDTPCSSLPSYDGAPGPLYIRLSE